MAKHDADQQRELTPLEEIISRCSTSRERRRQTYRMLRQLFLRGTTDNGQPALFNRIHSTVELLASIVYAPESAKFFAEVEPSERKDLLTKLERAREIFDQTWRNSGSDIEFSANCEWAAVYGTLICKVLRNPTRFMPMDPSQFGVMREDIQFLDKQPAFCMWYVISLPELKHKISHLSEDLQDQILNLAQQNAYPNNSAGVESGMPGGMMGDVIVTSISDPTNVTGLVDFGAATADRPDVAEPLAEVVEVWQRCEYEGEDADGEPVRFWDWKVTTCIGQYELYSARNTFLPYVAANPANGGDPIEAEQPFVALRMSPMMGYFWGRSEIAGLARLQDAADDLVADIRELLGRQMDPSFLASGVPDVAGKLDALRKRGGGLATQIPGARLQPLMPQFPPQAMDMLMKYEQMFREESGIPEDLGTAQDEIRVQGQIGGTSRKMGRIRKKALIVEDALEVLATKMFHAMQRDDETLYSTDDGDEFRLANLPSNTVIKVSAHSASPVYAEQASEKAMILMKAGAIELPDLVEIIDPPRMEILREKAKGLQQAQAEAAKEERRIEELKVTRPARR